MPVAGVIALGWNHLYVTAVPGWRGLQARIADALPHLTLRAAPLIVAQGRRAQRKLRASGGPR